MSFLTVFSNSVNKLLIVFVSFWNSFIILVTWFWSFSPSFKAICILSIFCFISSADFMLLTFKFWRFFMLSAKLFILSVRVVLVFCHFVINSEICWYVFSAMEAVCNWENISLTKLSMSVKFINVFADFSSSAREFESCCEVKGFSILMGWEFLFSLFDLIFFESLQLFWRFV